MDREASLKAAIEESLRIRYGQSCRVEWDKPSIEGVMVRCGFRVARAPAVGSDPPPAVEFFVRSNASAAGVDRARLACLVALHVDAVLGAAAVVERGPEQVKASPTA